MTTTAPDPSTVCDHARVHRRGGRNWRVAALATLALLSSVAALAPATAIAAAEARALLAGIGRQNLQAIEIGNEPDLYNTFAWYRDRRGRVVFSRPISYNLISLIGEFARWRAAMPRAPIAGPAFSMLSWLGGFLSAEPHLAVATFHRYPLRACLHDPTSPLFASIPNLLADPASAGLAAPLAPYVQQAHAEHIPFRLDEL